MNVCRNCQGNNLDGAKFCRSCGAELSSFTMPDAIQATGTSWNPGKKPKKKRIGMIVALVLLVLLLAAVAVWFFILPQEREEAEKTIAQGNDYGSVIAQEGSLVILEDGDLAKVLHNGEIVLENVQYESSEISLDANSAVILADGSLWYCNNGIIEEVTDNVVESYDMASMGGALIYETADGLFFYDAAKNDSVKVIDGQIKRAMISGRGTYVAYFKDGYLYRWDGVETLELGRISMALSTVGEDGTVITATGLYDANGGVEIEEGGIPNFISADGTQRICSDESVSYVVNGSGGVFDDMESLYWISYKPRDVKALQYTGELYITPLHLTTLTDQFYYGKPVEGNNGLYYLNEEMELVKIDLETEGHPGQFEFFTSFAPGDQYVYFLETYGMTDEVNDEYCTLHRVDRQTQECEIISDGVWHMEAAGDGIVYYVTTDKELYRYDGQTKECLLQNASYQIAVASDGTAIVCDFDGNLYRMEKDSEPEKIAKNVANVYRDGRWFYYTTDDGSVYISDDGEDFDKLGKGNLRFGIYW